MAIPQTADVCVCLRPVTDSVNTLSGRLCRLSGDLDITTETGSSLPLVTRSHWDTECSSFSCVVPGAWRLYTEEQVRRGLQGCWRGRRGLSGTGREEKAPSVSRPGSPTHFPRAEGRVTTELPPGRDSLRWTQCFPPVTLSPLPWPMAEDALLGDLPYDWH